MKSILICDRLIVNITVLKRPCSKLWATCFLLKMNSQHLTLMVLLDLSTAFDTVDHNILLERPRRDVGIRGKVLHWFSSYLSNRSQLVSIDGSFFRQFSLDCDAPQGYCLGPLLFVIYTSSLLMRRYVLWTSAYVTYGSGWLMEGCYWMTIKPNFSSSGPGSSSTNLAPWVCKFLIIMLILR